MSGELLPQPLRVAQVSAHLSRAGGGIFTSLFQLSRALAEQPGVEVEIFGPKQEAEELAGQARVRLFPRVGPASFGYAPGLVRGLIAAGPEVVHVHGLWGHPSVAGTAFTRRTGKARVVSPHGMLDGWALRHSGWKKRIAAIAFENRNLRGAGCLHALCPAEAEAMHQYGLRAPICVIPNGVEEERDDARPLPETGRKTLLFLGRLHPKKGLADLLRAWKRVRREPWELVIAGWEEGGHERTLRQLAASLGLGESVSFPGPLFGEAKRAALRECDGLILPSLSEGLPMVLLEAWAWGKPVLMTPQCHLPEGFAAGAAMRIEPGVDGIAPGLEEFLALDDAHRQRMGGRGRGLVRTRFAWPAIAADMKRVYEWVCGRGDRPPYVVEP